MHAGHAYAGCTHKYRNAQTLDTFVHVEQGRKKGRLLVGTK